MNDSAALEQIKDLVARGYVRFTIHAHQRMATRGATSDDVLSALSSSTSAERQENGTHRCSGGADLDGDDMTVIVSVEADVVVITLF